MRFLFAISICLASSAFAVTFTQSPACGTSTSTSCSTSSGTVTAGDTIVVTFSYALGSLSGTNVTDTLGNTYTFQASASGSNSTTSVEVWTTLASTSGGTNAVTTTISSAAATVCCYGEYGSVGAIVGAATASGSISGLSNLNVSSSFSGNGACAGGHAVLATRSFGVANNGVLRNSAVQASIAFVQAPTTGTAMIASSCSTGSATFTTGNAIVVVVVDDVSTNTVSSISQSSGSNTYSLQVAENDASAGTKGRVEIWTATNITGGTFSVKANYAGTGQDIVCTAVEYSHVGSIGTNTVSQPSAANPSITLTTSNTNSWCVGGFAGQGTHTFTAGTGNLRGSGVVTNGQPSGGEGGATVDNSESGSTSCTTSVTNADTTWAAASIELKQIGQGGTIMDNCTPGSCAGSCTIGDGVTPDGTANWIGGVVGLQVPTVGPWRTLIGVGF